MNTYWHVGWKEYHSRMLKKNELCFWLLAQSNADKCLFRLNRQLNMTLLTCSTNAWIVISHPRRRDVRDNNLVRTCKTKKQRNKERLMLFQTSPTSLRLSWQLKKVATHWKET